MLFRSLTNNCVHVLFVTFNLWLWGKKSLHWLFTKFTCVHVCGLLPNDARALLCFPLFGFLMTISRSCSTCPMRTTCSKPIIPDQTWIFDTCRQVELASCMSVQPCPYFKWHETIRYFPLLVFMGCTGRVNFCCSVQKVCAMLVIYQWNSGKTLYLQTFMIS